MKWGRIIKENSLHLEKLVLCGSLLFCYFTLVKTTKRTARSKANMYILMANSQNDKIKGCDYSADESVLEEYSFLLSSYRVTFNRSAQSMLSGAWHLHHLYPEKDA